MTATPPAGGVPVTVVIAAHNEGDQIEACVRSVSWAAEVLVVENDSTDDTVARAVGAGATVFSHPFQSIGAQRNAAIARASQPWVLVLDADERASAAFGEEVRRRIGESGVEAYRVPRRNWFLGREIQHSGWNRDRPVRLFRNHLRYDERPVHEHVLTQEVPGLLREALLHRPYANLGEYFEKLGRYSRDWARQNLEMGRHASFLHLVFRPQARFLSTFFLRGGWRDGGHGLVISLLAGVSVASKYAHLWALQHERNGAEDPWQR
ncbi:MAG TPA: glycosyltransferase family 2 protein [Gemmatimonadaceae bacterium]